ncbi:non-specific serine/threonine protein kinase [Ranunculus cassubicifolius]
MSLAYYMLESLLFLSQLHLHSATDCEFSCGSLGDLYPPFSNSTNSKCAMFVINCTEDEPKVQFRKQGRWYPVSCINLSSRRIQIRDQELEGHLRLTNVSS